MKTFIQAGRQAADDLDMLAAQFAVFALTAALLAWGHRLVLEIERIEANRTGEPGPVRRDT